MSVLRGDSSLQYVKGVGPVRAGQFAALGLHTVADLLEYFPFRHEPEPTETDIDKLALGERATIRGEIIRMRGGRRGRSRSCTVHDGTDT